MSTKDWPALPSEDDWRSDFEDAVMRSDEALEARLRDTAAALEALVEAEWMVSHDWGGDRASVMTPARAILAKLKEEGLT